MNIEKNFKMDIFILLIPTFKLKLQTFTDMSFILLQVHKYKNQLI